MTSALDKLNPRQRAFVHAYVAGDTAGNAAASYEAAGYKARGKAAGNAGHRLLGNVGIREAVAELRAETVERAEEAMVLSAAERLHICAEIARDGDESARARLAAIKLDAELRGELVQKVETKDVGAPPKVDPRNLSASTLRELAVQMEVVGD